MQDRAGDDLRGQVRTHPRKGDGIPRIQIHERSALQGRRHHDAPQKFRPLGQGDGLLRRRRRLRAERRGGEFDGVRQQLPLVAIMASSPIRTVLVTGANGYLASHIVKQLLEKGYNVHACVRNADNVKSIGHLLKIPSAPSTDIGKLTLFSTGDMGDKSLYGRYANPLADCDAVIHAASPLSPKLSGREFDGERDMLNPGMEGTQEVLDSIHTCPSVQCLVLTSSMSAAAPTPEPIIKDESHWSDDAAQLSRGNYYGCLKTRQERLCHKWVKAQIDNGRDFRFSAICPTMILGPPVGAGEEGYSYTPTGTMGALYKWITGGKQTAPNDSMSFIHVRDCAAMHVAALEDTNASGRYFSLVESLHWNDILSTLKDIYPAIPLNTPFKYQGDDIIVPTKFNLDRMNSLGIKVMSMTNILKDSVDFFKEVGSLK